MPTKNSMFTEEVLAAELNLASARNRFDVIAAATERFKTEGKDSLAAISASRLVEAHGALMAARHAHFELLTKTAEEARLNAFQEAHDLWIDGVEPYNDLDKFPDTESVVKHLAATREQRP